MLDGEMVPQSKPAEMSFSDWKKMKSAISTNEEKSVPKKRDPPRNRQTPTTKAKNDSMDNFNHNSNHSEFRNPQSLLYFEYLKQNNQRIFGGNVGFGCNLPIPNIPFVNTSPTTNMNCFNQQSNNASSFNQLRNNASSFNQQRNNASTFNQHRNNTSSFNQQSNNASSFTPQRNNASSSFGDDQLPANNFTPSGNDFMMSKGSIPQQPFPMNNFSNVKKMSNPFRSNNSNNYQTSTDFRSQHKAVTNRKFATKKNTKPAMDTTTPKPAVEDTSTTPTTFSKPTITEQVFVRVTQPTTTSKSKKQRWVAKPKPPIMIGTETKEERQRMWREYREKMKPLKNREYQNAKRVVQRLGKKNFDELDEKEKERLARAKETMTAHKAMLTEKAAKRWVLANESSSYFPTASTSEQPSGSLYVPTSTQPSTNELSPPNLEPANDNKTLAIDETNENRWNLWNNFIPGGVVFNSTEK